MHATEHDERASRMSKHISEVSVEEMTNIGREATLEARQKALESGADVISKDQDGQLVSEKMSPGLPESLPGL